MKTCYYELLDVQPFADDTELKKAYRRKALQYHPDKNPDNVEEATEIFATIRAAYEVLSDPQERAWYDSHKEQILNDEPIGLNEDGEFEYEVDAAVTGVTTDELLMFFNSSLYTRADDTPAGVYQIAGRVFAKIAKDEVLNGRRLGLKNYNLYKDDQFEYEVGTIGYLKAYEKYSEDFATSSNSMLFPGFGKSSTDYEYLKSFYKRWSSFNTSKSFSWKDEYMYSSNYDRRTKREINKRNEKARQNARNEYNKTVKRFVAFIKKLDKRMKDGLKRSEEIKRSMARQRQKELKEAYIADRKSKLEGEFKPQDWQEIDDQKLDDMEKLYDESNFKDNAQDMGAEVLSEAEEVIVYDCFLCNKRFKSEKQLENHCNTKLHKKKIAEVQREMRKESMTLGLDDLSDLEEFSSADESLSPKDSADDDEAPQADKESSLNSVEEELARIEEQLAQMETAHSDESQSDSDSESSISRTSSSFIADDVPSADEDKVLTELLASLNGETESDDNWSDIKKLTKLKSKQNKNKTNTTSVPQPSAAGESCGTCGARFDSRNKLFKHVKTSNHAALRSEIRSKGTKKSKRKAKR